MDIQFSVPLPEYRTDRKKISTFLVGLISTLCRDEIDSALYF